MPLLIIAPASTRTNTPAEVRCFAREILGRDPDHVERVWRVEVFPIRRLGRGLPLSLRRRAESLHLWARLRREPVVIVGRAAAPWFGLDRSLEAQFRDGVWYACGGLLGADWGYMTDPRRAAFRDAVRLVLAAAKVTCTDTPPPAPVWRLTDGGTCW